MRRVSKDVPCVNPVLNAPANRIGWPKLHRHLPDPRCHQLFPGMLEPRFAGFGISGGEVQAEVELDPGDLPLFIVREAGQQPVWIETQIKRDAVLREFAGTHIFGDPAVTVGVFNHAEQRPWSDLRTGVGRHAAASRNKLAMRAANLSPLNRDSMVSCALRERSAASRLSRVSRKKASASARGSSDGTSNPLTPSWMSSGIPEIGVLTTGTPTAIASIRTLGIPSRSPFSSTRQGRQKALAF